MTKVPKPDGKPRSKSNFNLGKKAKQTLLQNKHCILQIKNPEDQLCCAWAIILTMAHLHKDKNYMTWNHYENIRLYPHVQL